MMEGDDRLTLDWKPSGRQQTTVTARHNGEVLAVETFNLTKGKARDAFADAVCRGRTGIDRQAVGGELLRLAAEYWVHSTWHQS